MIIDELITDRTQADVDRFLELKAKSFENMTSSEQLEWSSSMKGSYNNTDLNRVGQAMIFLMEELQKQSYTIKVTPKTDWVMEDIPTPMQLNHLLEDVQTCRDKLKFLVETPPVPETMEQFTYDKANDIEQIFVNIYDSLQHIINSKWARSGEYYSGEVII